MRTYQAELLVVSSLLALPVYLDPSFQNAVCSLAVLLTFCHCQVSDRLREKSEQLEEAGVECSTYLNYYWYGKEVIWFLTFLAYQQWSALLGSIIFLLYPIWRKYWRS